MKSQSKILSPIILMWLILLLTVRHSEAVQQYQGVCSIVGVEIAQELTLERTGFMATLSITNNEGEASVTNFSAVLTMSRTDSSGQELDAADQFFVQPPTLVGINSIDGTDIIPPGQTVEISWFMIPKTNAGGTSPEGMKYQIGAQLAGMLYDQEIDPDALKIYPDTITVKPEAMLKITYFQPRDVDGDNPFTLEIVESPIPFTLGVLVENVGYNAARKLKIESQQPNIVRNNQGLIFVAQLLGSRVGDAKTDHASLTVDLGDIDPGKCRKGAWDMITSMSGEFTRFEVSYTHAPELGGQDTSIIQEMNAWFFVHEVMSDLSGRDNLLDFLARTDQAVDYGVEEPETIPDTLFETDCNTVPVNFIPDAEVLSFEHLEAKLRAIPLAEDWNMIRIDDPAQGKYKILEVVRSDGKVLDPNNYWATRRYRYPDNYEYNFLSIFDFTSLATYEYTVVYQPEEEDFDAPVTTLLFSGEYEQLGNVTHVLPSTKMLFIAEDVSPVGTYYRLDGAPEFQPAYPFSITSPGLHSLEYYSEDALGNRESPRTVSINVSNRSPVFTSQGSSSEELFVTGDALSIRPSEVQVDVTVDTSSGMSYTAAAAVFRGTYAWPSLMGVPSSPTQDSSAELLVSGENLDFYQYRINGGTWAPEQPVIQPIELDDLDGPIQLDVRGRHTYGAYPDDTDLLSASWVVSSQAPPTSVVALSPLPTRLGDVDFRVSGTSLYRYTFDNDYYRPEVSSSVQVQLRDLSDAPHILDVIGKFGDWQSMEVPTSLEVPIDMQYGWRFPEEEQVYHEDLGDVSNGTVQFVWDGTDDAGQPVTSGWYTIKLTVTDSLGRASSSVFPVQIGDMLPDIATLSPTPANQDELDAAGDFVVWQDQRAGTYDIFAQNMRTDASPAVPLTGNGYHHKRPRTDGRFVVWEDRQPDGNWDIWAQDLASGGSAFAVTATTGYNETRPSVHFPWVVYQRIPVNQTGVHSSLVAFNLKTGQYHLVDGSSSQDQLDPEVNDDRVVWQDFRDVGYGEIYLKDLTSGQIQRISQNAGGQYKPMLFDQWIVWVDNRNTQLDLYGYNLRRGVEIQLTNTPEDESSASLQGDWVTYVQESATNPSIQNVRMLHLPTTANIQLTNSATTKRLPTQTSGRMLWVDINGSHSQVLLGSMPALQGTGQNSQMVVVTPAMSTYLGTAFELLRLWHEEAGVASLTRYTALIPTPITETAVWTGGATGTDFPLEPGSFVWLQLPEARVLDLGFTGCSSLTLESGTNVVSYTCFPNGYSAYQLIRSLGVDKVSALRVLETASGRWQTTDVIDNLLIGDDTVIPNSTVVLLEMKQGVTSWRP